MGIFKTGNDYLYVKTKKNGECPYKYLYIHLTDDNQADEDDIDFYAYFDILASNKPKVSQLENKIVNEIIKIFEDGNNEDSNNEDGVWEKAKHIELITGCLITDIEESRKKLLEKKRT